MGKRLVGFILIMAISCIAYTQTVLLEQHVDEDTTRENYGPNLKHYMYTAIRYGLVSGSSDVVGLPVKYGNASEITWGIKYKNRLSDLFSWGLGINYSAQYFPLKQDSSKIYPNSILHDKERFTFNNLGADLFARINFDNRRGNVIGTYIDLGGYLDWVFLTKYYTKDKNPAGSMSKNTEVTQTGLTTTHNFNYGATAKIGYKSIALVAKYRFSDIFISRYDIPEFPRFIFGIEIATIN
ncbi:MAG: hypothetical protein JKY42_01110 [Flavobacteriales bacterium]|nr:hypothetical protein [Flavobacteriales bacterium]